MWSEREHELCLNEPQRVFILHHKLLYQVKRIQVDLFNGCIMTVVYELRRRYKAKCQNQSKMVNLSCSKTINEAVAAALRTTGNGIN